MGAPKRQIDRKATSFDRNAQSTNRRSPQTQKSVGQMRKRDGWNDERHFCETCGYFFNTRAAWTEHMAEKHDVRPLPRPPKKTDTESYLLSLQLQQQRPASSAGSR